MRNVSRFGGYRYAAFFIDEYSRFVTVEFLKTKDEVINATKRAIAKFDALVGVPVGEDGKPLSRPKVRRLHRDHEGQLESFTFKRSLRHCRITPHAVSSPKVCCSRALQRSKRRLRRSLSPGRFHRRRSGLLLASSRAPTHDSAGRPLVCVVEKPIYDIPQAGRRLQRKVFPWCTDVYITEARGRGGVGNPRGLIVNVVPGPCGARMSPDPGPTPGRPEAG